MSLLINMFAIVVVAILLPGINIVDTRLIVLILAGVFLGLNHRLDSCHHRRHFNHIDQCVSGLFAWSVATFGVHPGSQGRRGNGIMKQRGFIDRLRETLRLQSSYNIITLYMMDMALDRGWIGAIRRYFVSLTYGVPRLNAPLSTPVKVRLMLQDLGPIYVKVQKSSTLLLIQNHWPRPRWHKSTRLR
jgi:hypothetical protein